MPSLLENLGLALAGFIAVAVSVLGAVNVTMGSRRDVVAAHLVCQSVGEPWRELRDVRSAQGVVFDQPEPGRVRVGYMRFWFSTRWLCRLSIGADGLVISTSKRT